MPRIIAKFGYMKANNKKRSRFLDYIARRSGVIKNLETNSSKPATSKQNELIEKLIKDYPKILNYESYTIYNNNQTLGNASELITEIEEDYFTRLNHAPEYLSYIAERPRVQKEGSHGLFTSHDEKIILSQLKDRISNHKGHIWAGIISLKREDAHRLQYEDLKSWKILVRALQNNLAENLQIDYENFEWYGAFHNEAHHPHIHLVMFSKDGRQGYLSKQSIGNIRGAFAKQIFKHDLMNIYRKQTHYRDQIKLSSESFIKSKVDNIMSDSKPNRLIDIKLIELSKILKSTRGKHTYGYLPKPTKALVDEIVNLISVSPEVKDLLDLWYLQRQEILYTYSNKKEQIKNLSDIDAFRSVKNMVIRHADDISNHGPFEYIYIDIEKEENSIIENVDIQDQHTQVTLESYEDLIEIIPLTTSVSSNEPDEIRSKSVEVTRKEKRNLPYHSLKLLFSISKMFEASLISQAQKYHADQELLKNIKRQKIALGHHHDDK